MAVRGSTSPTAIGAVAFFFACSTSPWAQESATSVPPPSIPSAPAGPTKVDAERWFYLDVVRCLYSLERGGGIADLPAEAQRELRPALPQERFLYPDPKVKVWATDKFSSHVLAAERNENRCEVVADQLPVEATFKGVMGALHQADRGFIDYKIEPGYNPIVYQLEKTEGGFRYIVHLEGSEPGGLGHPDRMLAGHAFRFSLLNAFVIKQPESAKPPFR